MRDEFQNIEIPDELDQVVNQSMQKIYVQQRKKRIRKVIAGCTASAAVFAGGIFFCVSNPTLAADLPLIGHIFDKMQNSFSYGGDYSQVGTPLQDEDAQAQAVSENVAAEDGVLLETVSVGGSETEITGESAGQNASGAGTAGESNDSSTAEQVSAYTKTEDGLTVTLSEVYCNEQALYITMQLKSEEPFEGLYGLQCETMESYSFDPTQQRALTTLDGEFVDEYTFAGLMRLDLNEKKRDIPEYEAAREAALAAGEEWDDSWSAYEENPNQSYVKTVEVPENFTLDFTITQIFGGLKNPDTPDYGKTTEELDAMSDEEWHEYMTQWYNDNPDWQELPNEHYHQIFNGSWQFTIEVQKNTEDTQIVEVNDVNDLGIGIEKVVKDRFEITMYDTYSDGAYGVDYMPVMLDADGILMDYGSDGSVSTVAINDRDVSRVDIFLIDYYKWMDSLKGDKWRQPGALTEDGRTFKELLLEECSYHTEVIFEQD